MDYFNNLLQLYTDKEQELILTGDFNIDILNFKNANLASSYVDALFANGLLQTVLHPTRCTPNSATCLDHILTNCNQTSYETCIILNRISDHFPTVFWKDLHKKTVKPKHITVRDFSEDKVNEVSLIYLIIEIIITFTIISIIAYLIRNIVNKNNLQNIK